ncbi:TPA: helix-turn-helix domain-containing protein [Bacillus toyonensis]|nr:helix-turn-helix domain-containing protein [Bacillus toyonensis]
MANSKAKQRKKRMKKQMKRQLQKRIKEAPIVPMTFREIEDMRVKEQTDLHNAKENEKLERTALYQRQLDAMYNGTVTPLNTYINPNASILHQCSKCHKEWFARPIWLLTRGNQKHICGVDPYRMSNVKKSVRIVTDENIEKMCKLAEQGMSVSKIAVEIGVSRPTVVKYLKKAEEGKVLI